MYSTWSTIQFKEALRKRNVSVSTSGKKYIKIFVSGMIVSIITFCVVKWMTNPPTLPAIDMDHYWSLDPKPANITITPFDIEFPEMVIDDLKERLLHHRLPPAPLDSGFSFGFNTHFLKKLVDFWRNKYNFKEREKFLNKYNHYMTNIQGLDIHFMHVKPKKENATVVPLLLLHGWPSSIREFYEMIPDLMKPRDDIDFVFEIIAPSLPGFGFSEGTIRSGLGVIETSIIIHNLMRRIGHNFYYIHGGNIVAVTMATLFPYNVKGFHAVAPNVNQPMAYFYIWLGSLWPNLIETEVLQSRLYPITNRLYTTFEESGQFHLEVTKPDTIGIALSDSPAGLAAYILDRFASSNPKNTEAYDGRLPELYSLTKLLDNIMIYWITNSITTGMRVFKETLKTKPDFFTYIDSLPTRVPTTGIKFKYTTFYQPDDILRMKYINYLRTTVVDDGGNYPAYEKPDILANDIIEAVDLFLKFNLIKGESQLTSNSAFYTPSPITTQTVYDFTANDIHGKPIKLSKYKGNLLIIVNVASQSHLADVNYKEFNVLHNRYYQKGLRILAFPCNQFNNQESGSSEEILKYVKEKNVLFDVFEKIEVNGENAHPLWNFLKYNISGTLGDFIPWNFAKFIVGRNGIPIERISPPINPLGFENTILRYI